MDLPNTTEDLARRDNAAISASLLLAKADASPAKLDAQLPPVFPSNCIRGSMGDPLRSRA